MFKCFSDCFGNMPCDNGTICDKCNYIEVEKIDRLVPFIAEEDEVIEFELEVIK